ncbi:MAG: preprotein translocase subunit SecD [Patescibacteria group bacterium]|nr:protein translocase subunit SecD [Patescibacteria group bacterium]MDE1940668.1 preprotein translocase subunit SecD [Patescibacteria group bacterium]MDE1966943.1 preprotein translocase subunit SecD [Patescibacteria group bacterium]
MLKHRARAVMLLVAAVVVGYFVYATNGPGASHPFVLGLDLSGGTHLVYQADVSKLAPSDIPDAMTALHDDVERRVNVFGVSEAVVQTEQGAALSSAQAAYKLIVELPGVTNVDEAVKAIGATPELDFRLATAKDFQAFQASTTLQSESTTTQQAAYLAMFKPTGLNGGMVSKATLQFNSTTNEPVVGLNFNSDGTALFDKITKEHTGDYLGIFLDGQPIEVPVIREEIPSGQAQISGGFTVAQAQELVRNINFGALPIPITLISSQTIGPSLGQEAVNGGIKAGIVAFIIIAIFLIAWYRLPGLVATIALAIYVTLSLLIFKLGVSPTIIFFFFILMLLAMRYHWGFGLAAILFYVVSAFSPGALAPVTLTAAGIAGFILSIGMAVDANILIFERMKEELAKGATIPDAMQHGFERAWLSIRDSNISSVITGFVLYLFGSTSIVTGFALVFVVGVVVSMFTAITISRLFLYALAPQREGKISRFLISNGFRF